MIAQSFLFVIAMCFFYAAPLPAADSASKGSAEAHIGKLYAVHATDFYPEQGTIRVAPPDIRVRRVTFRPTTHFAIGHMVSDHSAGAWSRKKYAILTPVRHLLSQGIVNFHPVDSFILGDFRLSYGSIILVPAGETERMNDKLVHFYDGSLRDAVAKVLKKVSLPVDSSHDFGFRRGQCMIGDVDFCDPMATIRMPGIQSVGGHYVTHLGSAFLFGVVDIGSRILFTNWNLDPFFGRDRLTFDLVNWALDELRHYITQAAFPQERVEVFFQHYDFLKRLLTRKGRNRFPLLTGPGHIGRVLSLLPRFQFDEFKRNFPEHFAEPVWRPDLIELYYAGFRHLRLHPSLSEEHKDLLDDFRYRFAGNPADYVVNYLSPHLGGYWPKQCGEIDAILRRGDG